MSSIFHPEIIFTVIGNAITFALWPLFDERQKKQISLCLFNFESYSILFQYLICVVNSSVEGKKKITNSRWVYSLCFNRKLTLFKYDTEQNQLIFAIIMLLLWNHHRFSRVYLTNRPSKYEHPIRVHFYLIQTCYNRNCNFFSPLWTITPGSRNQKKKNK